MDWLLPCAFWTSCCPHHLNDDGASSLYVSSQSADDSVPPLLPRLSGCTWNFYLSYGNLQEVETVSSESSANSNQEKKRKKQKTNKKSTQQLACTAEWYVVARSGKAGKLNPNLLTHKDTLVLASPDPWEPVWIDSLHPSHKLWSRL